MAAINSEPLRTQLTPAKVDPTLPKGKVELIDHFKELLKCFNSLNLENIEILENQLQSLKEHQEAFMLYNEQRANTKDALEYKNLLLSDNVIFIVDELIQTLSPYCKTSIVQKENYIPSLKKCSLQLLLLTSLFSCVFTNKKEIDEFFYINQLFTSFFYNSGPSFQVMDYKQASENRDEFIKFVNQYEPLNKIFHQIFFAMPSHSSLKKELTSLYQYLIYTLQKTSFLELFLREDIERKRVSENAALREKDFQIAYQSFIDFMNYIDIPEKNADL